MTLDVSTKKVKFLSVSRLTPLAEPMRAYVLWSITQRDELEVAFISTFGNPYPYLTTYSFRRFGKLMNLVQSKTSILNKVD